MSPEQARGEANIDGRVDVYAVGVMFFECVVGDVPFDANNYNALLQIILGDPPPSPRSRGAALSPAIEQVILAAMDKRRDRRPPSARVFHDLLLEAGMQEDDAVLDIAQWTFSTPSAPPPAIDFDPDEFEQSSPGDDGHDAHSGRESMDMFPHLPGEFSIDDAPPARERAREQNHEAYAPEPVRAVGPPAQRGPRPVEGPAPRPIPAPPARLNDLPAFAGDAPDPLRRVPDPRGQFADLNAQKGPAGAPASQAKPANASPYGADRPRPPVRPYTGETSASEGGSSVARSVLGWLFAIAALAALAYLANTVFKRPDPRKARQSGESTTQGAPP
jgi:serine/threonine-protein kinase